MALLGDAEVLSFLLSVQCIGIRVETNVPWDSTEEDMDKCIPDPEMYAVVLSSH